MFLYKDYRPLLFQGKSGFESIVAYRRLLVIFTLKECAVWNESSMNERTWDSLIYKNDH